MLTTEQRLRSEIYWPCQCFASGCLASLPRQATRRARDAAAAAAGWGRGHKDGWSCPRHRTDSIQMQCADEDRDA